MARVKIDNELFQLISQFSQATGVTPKETIVGLDDSISFVVDGPEVGRAVGPGGRNVKFMENALKKKVRVIVYDEDLAEFIQNVVRPLQLQGMEREGNIITMHPADSRSRSLLIGRNAQHLRTFEQIVKRFFPDVEELKVA